MKIVGFWYNGMKIKYREALIDQSILPNTDLLCYNYSLDFFFIEL